MAKGVVQDGWACFQMGSPNMELVPLPDSGVLIRSHLVHLPLAGSEQRTGFSQILRQLGLQGGQGKPPLRRTQRAGLIFPERFMFSGPLSTGEVHDIIPGRRRPKQSWTGACPKSILLDPSRHSLNS